MYSITGVVSQYNSKTKKATIKVYDELNGKDVKSPSNEWITVSTEKFTFKSGDQIKAQISADKKDLINAGKISSKKHDAFKTFFLGISLKGTSMKDRIRLFNAFGMDVLKLANKRLPLLINNAQKYGYTMQSAVVIKAKSERIRRLFAAHQKLYSVGFGKPEVKHLTQKFGTSLGNIIAENPYMLLAGGFSKFPDSFSNSSKERDMLLKVDALVDNPSLPKWNTTRAFYVMEMIVQRMESKGSTAFSFNDVNEEISDVLQIEFQDARELLNDTLLAKGYKTIDAGNDGYFITPARNYNVEESVANYLIERKNAEDTKVSSRDLIFEDYYTDEQKQSIKLAITKDLLVVTGGAGTGKTTVVKGIIQNIKKVFGKQSEILLCAPTGKAAQRMSEATSLEAKTLHSMLKYNPDKGFMEANIPDDTKALIIDEASMIDSALMLRLLESTPKKTKIIFVGDIQQILPVKPGQPFKDMILSDFLPTVRLSVPQRTGAKSYIYLNANKVINGVMPTLDKEDMQDFHFVKTSSDNASRDEILRILTEDVEGVYNSTLKKVQVISPKRDPNGSVGMLGLNKDIQALLNSDITKVSEQSNGNDKGRDFYVGDKVVFNRNDYSLKLFNGDVGYITKKDSESGSLVINVDGKDFEVPSDKIKSLELANALSAHKTQGSEYDIVLMPLSKRHSHMLSPELIYTAITRAKKHFIFVGDESVIRDSLRNTSLNKRDTYLKARLMSEKLKLEAVHKKNNEEEGLNPPKLNPPNPSGDIDEPSLNNRPTGKQDIKQSEEEFEWSFDL
tara:strand:+ start:2157 stop:4526 length:2370 start_codon:yes stop_codon:yes gene_type:complete